MKHHLYSFIFLLLDTKKFMFCNVYFFYSFLLVDPHFLGLK